MEAVYFVLVNYIFGTVFDHKSLMIQNRKSDKISNQMYLIRLVIAGFRVRCSLAADFLSVYVKYMRKKCVLVSAYVAL